MIRLDAVLMRFDRPMPVACGLVDFDAATAPAAEIEFINPLADAFSRGQGQARIEAAAELEAALAQQAHEGEERFAAARADWTVTEADRLAESLQCALADIERRLSHELATVLKPFIAAAMQDRMIQSFAASFKSIVLGLGDAPCPALTLSGAADLLAAVRTRLDTAGIVVTYAENSDADLSVTLGDTTLRSHCAAWLKGLAPGETDTCP